METDSTLGCEVAEDLDILANKMKKVRAMAMFEPQSLYLCYQICKDYCSKEQLIDTSDSCYKTFLLGVEQTK
jgi:hypothetical protein